PRAAAVAAASGAIVASVVTVTVAIAVTVPAAGRDVTAIVRTDATTVALGHAARAPTAVIAVRAARRPSRSRAPSACGPAGPIATRSSTRWHLNSARSPSKCSA